MKKIFLSILFCSLFLTGCGHIKNTYVSDDTLKEKTAFALGVDADDITIVEKKAGLEEIRYIVKIKGQAKTKQCYFTTVLFVDSDAICSGTPNALTGK